MEFLSPRRSQRQTLSLSMASGVIGAVSPPADGDKSPAESGDKAPHSNDERPRSIGKGMICDAAPSRNAFPHGSRVPNVWPVLRTQTGMTRPQKLLCDLIALPSVNPAFLP